MKNFLRRIWAMWLRHLYLHTGSWQRIVEMLYWPIINMVTWGFTSAYFVNKFSNAPIVMGSLVGAVLLVEVFVRMSTTMLMLFLEEIWSRNLGHLFASPIRLIEYSCGVIWVGFVRTMIALTPAVIVAKLMFSFWIFSFGWHLTAYVPLLILNGCWYGLLLMALLLRYGLSAEWMAWMGTWFLIPVIAPYYPVAILPAWLQPFSHALPATYVFENMKAMVAGHDAPDEYLWIALGLNILYLIAATGVFMLAYRGARKNGGLLQVGE